MKYWDRRIGRAAYADVRQFLWFWWVIRGNDPAGISRIAIGRNAQSAERRFKAKVGVAP